MAELADAQASGACGSNVVWVQVPFPAVDHKDPMCRATRNTGYILHNGICGSVGTGRRARLRIL